MPGLFHSNSHPKGDILMINRKIEYFVTLAETLSFSRTAVIHNVSQTAISQYLAGLEKRLGVTLLDRSRHAVSLTAAGESYYRFVTDILKRNEEEQQLLHTLSAGYQGSLRVGVGLYESCSTEGYFSRFLQSHPEIKVDILQYPYSTLIEKLRLQELDIILSDALCEQAFSRRELLSRPLFASPNYLAAAPVIAEKYTSAADMLRGEFLITNCEADGPSSMSMLRNLLTDQFGFVPEDIAQTNSVSAQLMMVRAGHGVALVPGFVLDMQGQDLVRFDLPEPRSVRYNLMCLSQHDNPAAMLLFDFEKGSL